MFDIRFEFKSLTLVTFSGHPYWLLHDEEMKVRTTYPGYQYAVRNYYEALFGE